MNEINPIPNTDVLIKATDIANRLQISRAKAYQMLKTGEIPSVRFGGSVRVRECDLAEYIQRSWSGWIGD